MRDQPEIRQSDAVKVRTPTKRWPRELRDLVGTLSVAAPPSLVAGWLAWSTGSSSSWIILGGALVISMMAAISLRQTFAKQLRTISAVLASYREGDYSIRARQARGEELLFDVLDELNQLGETLREHRLGEIEAWTLLRKVMAEVDVVVLAFDDAGRIKLANNAAARMLGQPPAAMIGESAENFGLCELLTGEAPRIVKDAPASKASAKLVFQGHSWELRRGSFRLSGEPHQLVVLSDVSVVSRDSEREAWRRLIRVIGHEINNSLAPIQSISENLQSQAEQSVRSPEWEQDVTSGLGVIARRSAALMRFMTSYATLARLPPPQFAPVDLPTLVRKIAALEAQKTIEVEQGPELSILADRDQLEQVLINLVKNAVEAAPQGKTVIRWKKREQFVEIEVEDDGPGVAETANLFVPFFTTKPNGSGIGLVLSRQIVEAHRGQLSLATKHGESGTVACIRLPHQV